MFDILFYILYRYIRNESSWPLGLSSVCWCAKSFDCTASLGFYPSLNGRTIYDDNSILSRSNTTVAFKGLLVGCLPLTALMLGTLECLFDTICFEFVWSIQSGGSAPLPLTTETVGPPSQFTSNSTVAALNDKLFIEVWESQDVNYSEFFHQCNPARCTYSYGSRANFVYIFATLFALIGGLSSVLKVAAPFLVKLNRFIVNRVSFRTTPAPVTSISQGFVSVWERNWKTAV